VPATSGAASNERATTDASRTAAAADAASTAPRDGVTGKRGEGTATAGAAPGALSPATASAADRSRGPTTLKGKLAGGQFAAKTALLNDASLGSEVFLTIVDRDVTCRSANLADGDKHVQVRVPWKPGQYDLGSKKLGVKFGVLRGKKDLLGDASSATLEVISAPRQEGSTGRIRIRAAAPKETIDGEIDVRVCMDLR
jgi:hypothetical protein